MPTQQTTAFAPAERAAPERILEQSRAFVDSHCRAFFDTLPTMILALNCQRQVVFANCAAVSFLGYSECAQVLGKRPGEALGCVNADAAPAGCGTSTHCRNCGAVQAILAAVQGDVGDGECKLLRREQSVLGGLAKNAKRGADEKALADDSARAFSWEIALRYRSPLAASTCFNCSR